MDVNTWKVTMGLNDKIMTEFVYLTVCILQCVSYSKLQGECWHSDRYETKLSVNTWNLLCISYRVNVDTRIDMKPSYVLTLGKTMFVHILQDEC